MSMFLQKIFGQQPSKSNLPVPASAPTTSFQYDPNRENPFMVAMNRDSEAFSSTYGVNKPLKKAMFMGYKDDKPLYVGSRLFILY